MRHLAGGNPLLHLWTHKTILDDGERVLHIEHLSDEDAKRNFEIEMKNGYFVY